jgi:ABC-type branched-subunit amino acid transport system permease subunit
MTAGRIYRLLLRVYPAEFRSEYGREMLVVFTDDYRNRDETQLDFWAATMWDVARSAAPLWVEAVSGCWKENTKTLEVIMKLSGMLAVLLGVYGVLGASAEAVAGMRGTLDGRHLLAIVLGAIGAALLLAAGAALLRSAISGRHTATAALAASLVITLIARFTHPWMSIFTELVGIGLPIALLTTLHWPRGRGPSISEAT